jgi:hypothetical protein
LTRSRHSDYRTFWTACPGVLMTFESDLHSEEL